MSKRHYHLTSLNESGNHGIYTNYALAKHDCNKLARAYKGNHPEVKSVSKTEYERPKYGSDKVKTYEYAIALLNEPWANSHNGNNVQQWYALNPCWMECASDRDECNHLHGVEGYDCYFCNEGIVPKAYGT